MNKKMPVRIIFSLIVLVLAGGNVFFAFQSFAAQRALQEIAARNTAQQKKLYFTKMFVDKIINAEQEVSFEERLQLESLVRDLNDANVLAQWNRFVNSQSETEAQKEVKGLLSLLLNR